MATRTAPLPPIVDGFSLNLQMPNCNRWVPFTAHQMEVLRRSSLYRFHVFVAPEDLSVAIGPYDTFAVQLRIPAGSWIWAISPQSAVNSPSAPTSGSLLYRITDQGSGELLASNFISPGWWAHQAQLLLPEPRLVTEPGIVDVEIANGPYNTGQTMYAQLALWAAIPIQPMRVQYTECPAPSGGK